MTVEATCKLNAPSGPYSILTNLPFSKYVYSLSAEIEYLRVWYPRCNPSNTERPNNGNPAPKALGNSSPGHQTIGVLDPLPCLPPHPAPTRWSYSESRWSYVLWYWVGGAPVAPFSFLLAHPQTNLRSVDARRDPTASYQHDLTMARRNARKRFEY